jgi:hypothetical protein
LNLTRMTWRFPKIMWKSGGVMGHYPTLEVVVSPEDDAEVRRVSPRTWGRALEK